MEETTQELTSGDREAILKRIRQAVQQPAPKLFDGHAHTEGSATVASEPEHATRDWLPHVPVDREGQFQLFAELSAKLQTDFRRVPDWESVRKIVRELIDESKAALVACHDHPLVQQALEGETTKRLDTSQPFEPVALEPAAIGISACDALIAQTGSVLVSSRTCGGRALSVLPPHHIVIATADQMMADLTAAYDFIASRYEDRLPSMLSFITGPSRTGDIERILVLGAHGPKRLTILCLETNE